MCDMCDTNPVCDIDPLYMASPRVDTSGGRGFVVDMAEYGDTLEKIAADEIKRLREIPEVMKLFPDKATAKARGDKMLEQLDKEIFGRRDAVNKRLKITLQR